MPVGSVAAAGVFFDGATSERQIVDLALGDDALTLAASGAPIAVWPLDELRDASGPTGALRLTRDGGHKLARLEIRDAGLAAAIRAGAQRLHAHAAMEAGLRRKVIGWSVAAVASMALFGLYGVPALADRIAPLLPWSFDERVGRAVDDQIRLILPTGEGGFACDDGPDEAPGKAALQALAEKLSHAAGLPVPIRIVAVRRDIPNAFALPGGYLYLFDGLIAHAESPDEIAGVLAHEIGHVAGRDGTRRVIQAGGASFLLGFALGDLVGGGALVIAARELSAASYSREAETQADAYGVALMRRLGGDPKALGTILTRLTAGREAAGRTPLDYLASHPAVAERRRAIDAAAGDAPTTPLMDPAGFAALKRICGDTGGPA